MFLNDIINLTLGQLLIKYWYVLLAFLLVIFAIELFRNKRDK